MSNRQVRLYIYQSFEPGKATVGMALTVVMVALTFIGLIGANRLQSADKREEQRCRHHRPQTQKLVARASMLTSCDQL